MLAALFCEERVVLADDDLGVLPLALGHTVCIEPLLLFLKLLEDLDARLLDLDRRLVCISLLTGHERRCLSLGLGLFVLDSCFALAIELFASGVHGQHWSASPSCCVVLRNDLFAAFVHMNTHRARIFIFLALVEYRRGMVCGVLDIHEFNAVHDLVWVDRSLAAALDTFVIVANLVSLESRVRERSRLLTLVRLAGKDGRRLLSYVE